MVDVVGHVHVPRGVEGDAVGKAELPRPAARRAHAALEFSAGRELLDAVVVVVGHQHLARVRGDAARVGELSRAGALRAPLQRFAAAERESLDAIVARVGHVHVFARHRHAAAGGLGVILGGPERELPESAAPVAPRGQEVPVRVELLDAIVLGVHHVHVPRGVRSEPADRPELAVAAAVGAPLAQIGAGGAELLHDIAQLVGHIHVARGVQRHGLGEAQDRFRALPHDRRGGVGAGGSGARARAGFGAGERREGERREGQRRECERERERGEGERRERGTAAPWTGHRLITTHDRRARSGGEGLHSTRSSGARAGRGGGMYIYLKLSITMAHKKQKYIHPHPLL
jgi:hypothetical protein